MQTALVRAATHTALGALIAAPVGHWLSERWGWLIFCAALLVQMGIHLRHFVRLERWSRAPRVDTGLEGDGAWDDVFGRLYRHEKRLRGRIAERDGRIDMLIAAIQALTDGVVLLDEGNHILFCNTTAEDQLGLRLRTDRGQPVANLVRHPEFVSFLGVGDFSRPLGLRSERSPDRALLIHVIPYADNRRLMQIKDVTQADQLDRMRRDFVANVSHELRTPLTVLAGFLETLRDIEFSPEEQQRYLALMAEQSVRMQSIIKDLLALSSIESAPPPQDVVVDMATVIAKLQRDGEALSGGRHRLVIEADAELDLRGAEQELVSAFSNLVSNAIRYTPADGAVYIRWFEDEHGAVFSVQDTGIGIEARHIPRLTERFYRVDRGRSRDVGGTGLGLAIVKHALGRHQAQLEITSVPGEGSCFTARFPANRVVRGQANAQTLRRPVSHSV